MSKEIDIAPDLGAQLFPEETADEAVARIVAQNPQKHGVTLEQRRRNVAMRFLDDREQRRLIQLAKLPPDQRSTPVDEYETERALIVGAGGDPNEMMTGNKPRWTVDGDTIKDHLEGKEYGVIAIDAAPTITLDDIDRIKTEGPEAVLGAPDYTIDGEGAAASEHAANFLADKMDEITAQAIRGEFDTATKQACCAHSWPEDPDEDTRCPLCKMTFKEWVES